MPHHVQSGKAIFAIKANFILLPIAMIVLSIVVMYFYNLDKIYNQIKMTNKEN
ncbi:MFS transporter [Lactobacillus sp. ESL0259]|uniref:MFS transporter n=1 Tax=Lactobacillus sp. ESL0259 TaxID=2069346 RepID=UPI0011C37641|nr:MFS transporter [Lactobacillus sp. ESL0259]